MGFKKGQSGNPEGRRVEKPFADALRMEIALADAGKPTPAPKGSLRFAIRKLLERAEDDTQSIKEVADRLDGKPAAQLALTDPHGEALSITFKTVYEGKRGS